VVASGAGKAILSALDPAALAHELKMKALTRYTGHTFVERDALEAELAATRRRGYAIDDEEHAQGLRCVAAPILDEHGQPWAALSLAGPTARLTHERVPALGALVSATAREVTEALGGRVAAAATA
jgi:IclR family acetate operon transcriptional repressor